MGLGANAFVAIVLLFVLFTVMVYDSVALMFWNNTYTISWVIKSWSKHFPILPLVIGITIGHLFWPVDTDESSLPTETLHNGHDKSGIERMQSVTPGE